MPVVDPSSPSSAPWSTAKLPAVLARPARRLGQELNTRVQRAVHREVPGQVDRAVERRVGPAVRDGLATALAGPLASLGSLQQAHDRQRAQLHTEGFLLGAGTRVNRALPPEQLELLSDQLTELTGRADLTWPLIKAYRGLIDAETRGLGRIAGSTSNVLGKLVASTQLDAPAGPVLEIGTLFGLFSPLLVRQFAQAGQFRELTVVDPFAGFQVQPESNNAADYTGTPVSQEVAESNFATLGLPAARYRIVAGYSTDEAVRAEAGDRRYAVVVIDGDHSEAGVLADLDWVGQILVPGGVVVVDDCGDRRWPGVERALDRWLAGPDGAGAGFDRLGTVSTSAFVRSNAG